MSSPSCKAKRSAGGLQGPRPQPLDLPTSSRPSKRTRAGDVVGGSSGPVIVYEHTPRVVHARPHEFMAVVQKLTGKRRPSELAATATAPVLPLTAVTLPEEIRTAADPLVLTLGQQRRPTPPPFDDRSAPPPSPAAGGSLLSPTSFLFSPTTMQAIQELTTSLF